MNILDVTFAAIAAFLFLRGLYRGLLVETASLAGAVGGFFLANKYHQLLAVYAADLLHNQELAKVAAYLAIFFATIVLVTILARAIRSVLTIAPVKWLDQMGGAAAGLLKGVAICCIILAVLLRYFPEASFIAGSWSAPHLNRISNLLIKYLPDNISQRIPSEFTPKETI